MLLRVSKGGFEGRFLDGSEVKGERTDADVWYIDMAQTLSATRKEGLAAVLWMQLLWVLPFETYSGLAFPTLQLENLSGIQSVVSPE